MLADLIKSSLMPPARPSVVEWAEKVYLSERVSPNAPGFYRTERTPYAREILECFRDKRVRDLTLCMATQVSKSLMMRMGLAYRIDQDPIDSLLIMGTADSARSVSQGKFEPMVRENPCLAAHMPSDPDDFKALEQRFDRMTLAWAGANSADKLASRPIGLLLLDEIDKYPERIGNEAGAVELAEERTKSFSGSVLRVKASSPTHEKGPIWKRFLAGDQRYYNIPSPYEKKKFFKFEFSKENLCWDPEARDDAGRWILDRVRKTAHYVCPFTGEKIADSHKRWMMLNGLWIPENPRASSDNRSYHLNSFYSPWVTFGEMAVQYLTQRDLFGLQNFYNGWLGLPWRNLANKTEEADILSRRANYRRGTIPKKPVCLILGADVGQNYVRWAVGAFTENGELMVIDWGSEGTPGALMDLIGRTEYTCTETGEKHRINFGWVDAKYRKDEVHKICLHSGGYLWPAAGHGGVYSARGVWFNQIAGYALPYGLTGFNDRDFKTKLYIDRIKNNRFPGIQFPENVDALLVKELTNEELVEKEGAHSTRRYEWKRTGDNHTGDAVKLLLVGWEKLTMDQAPGTAEPPQPGDREYVIHPS